MNGVLEQLVKEIQLLNQNLRVINTELSTVDPNIKNEVIKEAPQKIEAAQKEVEQEAHTSVTLDEIKAQAAVFIKADSTNKEKLKSKLRELNAARVSDIPESSYDDFLSYLKG